MGTAALIMLILGVVSSVGSAIAGGVSNAKTNATNKEIAEKTNATNIALAREANAAQALESEKAYSRSKAANQVALLRQAGMSHAGALDVLNGGGSYTPAPVNTAQVQPYTQESSADIWSFLGQNLAGTFQNTAQMHEQHRQFQRQQAEIERANHEQEARERAIAEANASAQQVQSWAIVQETNIKLLKENPDNYALYSRLIEDVDPADYETAEQYISACVHDHNYDEVVPGTVSDQLVARWNLANTGKNVSANTRYTDKDTELLEQKMRELGYDFREKMSNRAVRDAANRASMSEAEYNEQMFKLQKLLVEKNISKEEAIRYYKYHYDQNGRLRHDNSFIEKLQAHFSYGWDVISDMSGASKLGYLLKGLLRI